MKIALDMDGVLSDFVGAMCKFLNARLGFNMRPEQVVSWCWYECPDIPVTKGGWDAAFALYCKENRFAEQPDFPEAVEAVERLRRMGHDLRIFTVRPRAATMWHPCAGIEIPITYCKGAAHKAREVAAWDADVFVDDHVDNCEAVAGLEDAPWVLLFARPYNADGWDGADARWGWDTLFDYLAHREMENTNDECGMRNDERTVAETVAAKIDAAAGKTVLHHGHPRFYELLDEIARDDVLDRATELLGFEAVGVDPWLVALQEDIGVVLGLLQACAREDDTGFDVDDLLGELTNAALVCRMAFEKTADPKRLGELLDEMRRVHDAKNHDYAGSDDPLANFRLCEAMGLPAWKGCLVRITDKVSRLQSFARQGELMVEDESVLDTLLDLANYAILCRVLFEECREPVGEEA